VRVLVAGIGDVESVATWSGTPYHMLCALRKRLGTEHVISTSLVRPGKLASIAEGFKYGCWLVGRRYSREFAPSALVSFARQLEHSVSAYKPDVVLSFGSQPIAMARVAVPVVMWSDATFSAMVHADPAYERLPRWSRSQGECAERLAISKVSVAVFCSTWAARRAIEDYGKDVRFVRVIPFGANLAVVPSAEKVLASAFRRSRELCDLLFVGVDWQRKRGDFAVDVTHDLAALGVHARMRVVGCSPKLRGLADSQVEVLGRLRKDVASELQRLEELYCQSHFLLLPSAAEPYGISYAEASAYALPSVAADVGGVATVVRPGCNGMLFSRTATSREYATAIARLWQDLDQYTDLCRKSRQEYEQRLNWSVSVEALFSILEEVCS
jgi:glycosyltransferase involved in cell wall biosynthesis